MTTTDDLVADICSRLASLLGSGDGSTPGDLSGLARTFAAERLPLATPAEVDVIADAAIAHVHGLGPLHRFTIDASVEEIMVNRGGEVWIDRAGGLERVGRLDADVAPRLVERVLAPLGRRLDRLSPIVDARLPDGSRLCAVIPPIAVDGPCFTLRRFGVERRRLIEFADDAVADLLVAIVDARCNVLVSGATSSGKTSLLNALATHVSPQERIVTLEDTAELRLDAPHVVRLETRAGTVDGTPPVTMTELVRASLRLRPDRIVVGEIRGAEVVDMLGAMNTGHDGSLTTCHANGALDAIRRLQALVAQHAPGWPAQSVEETIRSSIDVVVHVERRRTGERRVTEVIELAAPGDHGAHRTLVGDSRLVDHVRRSRR